MSSKQMQPTDISLIRLHKVTKTFRLGEFIGLKATFSRWRYWLSKLSARRLSELPARPSSSYRAVNNVSFSISRGERVGIVGLNGAGKSTLLKMISGIMSPSSGNIKVNGRLIPLLGVGAGFDQEMTGRENILIYGTVLGLSSSEIKSSIPEIVEFAEIDKYIDTPVKRFSKGMKARLGIAIAFTLRPDILIIDEVLAVGDLAFRSKCMDRIAQICDDGVALLFVSHSMSRLRATTDRCILIRNGELIADGLTEEILERYLKEDLKLLGGDAEALIDDEDTFDNLEKQINFLSHQIFDSSDEIKKAWISEISITDEYGLPSNQFAKDDTFKISMNFQINDTSVTVYPRISFFDENGIMVFSTIWPDGSVGISSPSPGWKSASVLVDCNILVDGRYSIVAGLYSYSPLEKHDRQTTECGVIIANQPRFPKDPQLCFPRKRAGYFYPEFTWQMEDDHRKI